MINVWYVLELKLVIEYSKDLKVQLPITIGTVPLGASSGNRFEQQEQHNQGILQRGVWKIVNAYFHYFSIVFQCWIIVCLCLRPFTVKASSVLRSWNAREQINDIMLKTFLAYAKSLHRYFRMKHQTFLTNHFILFTH